MSSINPSILNTVVRNTAKGEKINNITQFSAYMITLMHLKQRGVEFFQKNYMDFSTVSDEYRKLMTSADDQRKINCALGLELSESDKLVEDTMEFNSKHSQVLKSRINSKRLKTTHGAKLSDPKSNDSFSLEAFLQIKHSIEENKRR